jgi:hypothetical protein
VTDIRSSDYENQLRSIKIQPNLLILLLKMFVSTTWAVPWKEPASSKATISYRVLQIGCGQFMGVHEYKAIRSI